MRREMLIIEGDCGVARLFTEIFLPLGWRVDALCRGGGVAEALRGTTPYSIVLVSYHFPGTSGVEIIRLIRETEHRRKTPILMVAGSPDVTGEALAAGADAVMRKPVNVSKLIAVVDELISSGEGLEVRSGAGAPTK
jgi:DNA-binding response OmpR family regulator